jgi:hypothetical protein
MFFYKSPFAIALTFQLDSMTANKPGLQDKLFGKSVACSWADNIRVENLYEIDIERNHCEMRRLEDIFE